MADMRVNSVRILLSFILDTKVSASVDFSSSSMTPSKLKDLKKVAMSKEEFKKVEQLHYGWYVQAVGALLGAMGKELYKKMDRNNRRAFVACLDGIDKEYDLQSGAKCLVKAFDDQLVSSYPSALNHPLYDFVDGNLKRRKDVKKKIIIQNAVKHYARRRAARLLKLDFTRKARPIRNSPGVKWNIVPRTRKLKRQNDSKRRLKASEGLNEVRIKEWKRLRRMGLKRRSTKTRRPKRSVISLYQNEEMIKEAKRMDRTDSPHQPINMKSLPALPSEGRTPVKMLTDFLGSMWRATRNQTSADRVTLQNSYARLQELQRKVTELRRAAHFKHRMLDLVVGEENPLRKRKSFTERFRELMPENVVDESVYGLVDAVSRHTNDLNSKFLSPRFLPLLPDKYGSSKKFLSPNLFPFYKDDTDNSILPIPEVLEKSGLSQKDRDSILELVMDISGANEVVEKSMEVLKNLKTLKLGKDVFKITSAIDALFKDLDKSLQAEQRRDLAERQYSFLNKDQMNKLFGKEGMLNTSLVKLPFDIDEYAQLSREQREESLRNTVRLLAEDPKSLHRRHRRNVHVFAHTTLAPFIFAPSVLTLNVLGPVTLSPNLFSPNIIAPNVLSPPVLSPNIGCPLIISPYVLGPNTLSGAIFEVYVLSPYVLSPNILNPYLLSPMILSPYVLCPDLASPTLLSGVVLSPSLLSPSVYTESALSVNYLSPSFLS